ncbi:MAG: YciI family protein [Bacteroidota bacterium]
MKKITLITLVLFAFSVQQITAQKKNEEDNLKPYFFVMLKKGPNRDQDSIMAGKIQKGHIENINKLAASGKLNVAGPFLDEGDLRGIFIFDSGSEEEVRSFVDNDPAVKSGRLVYEIHPWMTQKGTCFK